MIVILIVTIIANMPLMIVLGREDSNDSDCRNKSLIRSAAKNAFKQRPKMSTRLIARAPMKFPKFNSNSGRISTV